MANLTREIELTCQMAWDQAEETRRRIAELKTATDGNAMVTVSNLLDKALSSLDHVQEIMNDLIDDSDVTEPAPHGLSEIAPCTCKTDDPSDHGPQCEWVDNS